MEGVAEENSDAQSKGKRDMVINVPAQEKPFSLWPGKYHSPVTATLWHARSSFVKRARNLVMDGPAQSTLQCKTPEENRTSVLYSLASDKTLREEYRNPWNSIRIGQLLEDLDALAGTIAVKHCSDSDHTTRPLLLVTASVDKISMKKRLRVDVDLQLAGAVAWVGRSSMEIRMEVIQPVRDVMEKGDVALIANFTFVARDWKTQKAAPVNHLLPQTEEEKQLFAMGNARDAHRKKLRMDSASFSSSPFSKQYNDKLTQVLREGRVLCEMPALADRNSILIRDTRLENAIICQPQQRNMHGRIFGGFLMRRAFEIAFSTAYVFGGIRPLFLEVDVGDFLRRKSCILYTETENLEQPRIHVEVIAHVTQPELKSSEVSNTFYFTFSPDPECLEPGVEPVVRRVLPATEEEARTFLARYEADHIVHEPAVQK